MTHTNILDTPIRVSKKTRDRLNSNGKKEDTYDSIINKALDRLEG